MKKKLHIDAENPIITECWNFCRLAVALSENNMKWYVEKFWDINIYDGFIAFYYEVDLDNRAMPDYDEVLKTESLIYKNDIISQVEETLDRGGYPIIFIHNEKVLLKDHEILIYGYDNKKERVYCMVYVGQPIYWKKAEYSYEELKRYFKEELDILKEDDDMFLYYKEFGYPALAVFRKEMSDRKINLISIYKIILKMLYSGYKGATGVKLYHSEDQRWVEIHRGIEIYKMYYESLPEQLCKDKKYLEKNYNVIKSIYKICESKKNIRKKITYLIDKNYIPDVSNLICQLNLLCKYLTNARLLLEKYQISGEEKVIRKMANNMQIAEIIDKSFMEQFAQILKREIKKEI